jgi:hypothetical protein
MMTALDTSFGLEAANEAGCAGGRPSRALGGPAGSGAACGAADWLGLAAAPTFAIMAALTIVAGSPSDLLCAAAREASPLSGMVPMYLLMSVFHSAPWLKLIARWRNGACQSSGHATAGIRFAMPFPKAAPSCVSSQRFRSMPPP